jgi:hypothetical protein
VNHQLSKENLSKIINFDCVVKDELLQFDIDDNEITISKPYIDEDGDDMGNTIFISKESLSLYILNDNNEPKVMFKENDASFEALEQGSPKYIIDYLNEIWPKIMIDMQEREDAWNGVGNELTFVELQKQFGTNKVPKHLKLLFDFENENGSESFSECFYLKAIDKSGLKSWSEDEVFLNAFIEFATANGSGSSYAYWLTDSDIEKCPIVVFGDEGGIHVVAGSTEELIHLLTYDTEISASHDGATFYKDEDYYEESENKTEFADWVKANFKLNPIETDEDSEIIISKAQDKYQTKLNSFLESFGIEL